MNIYYFHYGRFDGKDAEGYTRAINLLKGFSKKNHSIFLITTSQDLLFSKIKIENLVVYKFPRLISNRLASGGWDFLSGFIRASFLIFKKIDLAIFDCSHRPVNLSSFILIKYFTKSKIISDWWEYYGIELSKNFFSKLRFKIEGKFEIFTRIRSDAVVSLSKYLIEIGKKNKIKNSKLHLIHPGIDTTFVSKKNKKINNNLTDFKALLIGFNIDEYKNNYKIFDAIIENSFPIKIITTGTVIDVDKHHEKIFEQYGWLNYNEFLSLIETTHFSILTQKDTIKNRARFPNKFGDYVRILNPILTNFVGDLKHYQNYEGFIEIGNDYKSNLNKFIINYDYYKNSSEFEFRKLINKGSWNMVASKYLKIYKELCYN